MSDFRIYHNPRCSKSRQTLQLLQDRGIEPEVILYLQDTPSTEELAELLSKLAMTPRQLIRNKEADYKENNLADDSLTEQQLLEAMVNYPKLIERPIVVKGDKAVLGRPPENVLKLV